MKIKLGDKSIDDLGLPKNILTIMNTELEALRRMVKKEPVVSLYYIIVGKDGRTMLIPNLGEVPTAFHKELVNPALKMFDAEYLLLFCESSGLFDGTKRSKEDWDKIGEQYGNLNNHPNKKDIVQSIVFTKNSKHIGSAFVNKKSSKKGTRTFGELAWVTNLNDEGSSNLDGFFN